MSYVVLIEEPEKLDEHTEADMRRWWRHHCIKVVRNGATYFEVEGRMNQREGVKRLASFGIKARVARRPKQASDAQRTEEA